MLQETTPHQKECILCVIFVCVNYLVFFLVFFFLFFFFVCVVFWCVHSARREIGTKRTHFASLDDGTGTRAGVGWGGGDGGGGSSACSGRVTLGDNQTEGKRGTKEWKRDFHVMCVCVAFFCTSLACSRRLNSTQLNSTHLQVAYLTLP